MPPLLLSFYGDDFTGSTDAMESLARCGIRTVLFTAPPTREQLARFPDLRAFGVAGQTRSMTPEEMERTLHPVFIAMRSTGVPMVHYKVCSTFDSSPSIGNIGKVIEIGAEVFSAKTVPIVVGAPSLGRYCVFGNLFARCGAEGDPIRLDRHPSMSRHPVTPMDEADLRLHLSRQTDRPIALFDILQVNQRNAVEQYATLLDEAPGAVLIDLLTETQLPAVGELLQHPETPFIVGSSGVESALAAQWNLAGLHSVQAPFEPIGDVGPILAVCGSCSPVTARQILHATSHGFCEVIVPVSDLLEQELRLHVRSILSEFKHGQSVIVSTGGRADGLSAAARQMIGASLGQIAFEVLDEMNIRRVAVAGGDTSGQIARALKIESMEMIGELTRGAPLCRIEAPGSPADGIEITFKGGQIGKDDFFTHVRTGRSV